MNHVFFTNSGSESVDTAMKIALAYHRARGDGQRTRFISRERTYHGVNFGGLSLAGRCETETFNLTLPNISLIRHTKTDAQAFVRGQLKLMPIWLMICSAWSKLMAGPPLLLSLLSLLRVRQVHSSRRWLSRPPA